MQVLKSAFSTAANGFPVFFRNTPSKTYFTRYTLTRHKGLDFVENDAYKCSVYKNQAKYTDFSVCYIDCFHSMY